MYSPSAVHNATGIPSAMCNVGVMSTSGRTVDDVVVDERSEVEQLDRRRATDRRGSVAAVGQQQDQSGAMARTCRVRSVSARR